MSDFQCVNCGSDNVQIVRGIFESGTEAKYQEENDFTQNPTIGELLTVNNKDVVIESQTRLAERLGKIKLTKHIDAQLSSFVKDTHHKKQKSVDAMRISLVDKQKELSQLEKEKQEAKRLKQERKSLLEILIVLSIIEFFLILLLFADISKLGFLYWVLLILLGVTLIISYTSFFTQKSNTKKKILEARKKEPKIEAKFNRLKKEIEKLEQTIANKYKEINKEIAKNRREAEIKQEEFNTTSRKQIERKNQAKEKIWSNLYYCHRCDTVMDLDHEVYDQPENINNLVEKIYKDYS